VDTSVEPGALPQSARGGGRGIARATSAAAPASNGSRRSIH